MRCSDENYAKAQDALTRDYVDMAAKLNRPDPSYCANTNAQYGCFGPKLGDQWFAYACHVNLRAMTEPDVVWAVKGKVKDQVDTESAERWYGWLTDPAVSPWRDLFKRGLVCPPDGFIFTDTDAVWGNEINSFLCATRMVRQLPQMVRVWNLMVASGIHPSLAFILTGSLKWKGSDSVTFSLWSLYDEWSTPGCCTTDQYVFNFLDSVMPVKSEGLLPFRLNTGYRPVQKLFGEWAQGDSKVLSWNEKYLGSAPLAHPKPLEIGVCPCSSCQESRLSNITSFHIKDGIDKIFIPESQRLWEAYKVYHEKVKFSTAESVRAG